MLWFTFQYVSIKTLSVSNARTSFLIYLHSNMFLLRQKKIIRAYNVEKNLHSNMFLLRRWTVLSSSRKADQFTFQYVSIKTTIILSIFVNPLKFTFQYVSIKTKLYITSGVRWPYLHSNMFLLRRFCGGLAGFNSIHLHSNMFLLRQNANGYDLQENSKFTFQYVSIKTLEFLYT